MKQRLTSATVRVSTRAPGHRLALGGLAAALLALPAMAHGPVARVTDTERFEQRLFIADAATGQVVTLDADSGDVIARIQTPPYIMQLGLTQDSRYLFATRGRNTDLDFVTVIDTGVDPSFSSARPPFVARTLTAKTPGGIRGGRVASVGGSDALFMEGSAELVVLNTNDYGGMAGIEPTTYKLVNPDHYHYLEAGKYLYVGHLRAGLVQIIDRDTGAEVKRIGNCPVLHGMAKDAATGRLIFSCATEVVVIGTRGDELNQEIERIGFPEEQRTGAFQWGANRVLWGYTEGTLPMLYRMDLKEKPWRFDVLPVDRAIRQEVTEDGAHLLVLTRAGELLIHDGSSGEFIRKVTVSSPIEDSLHEHVDKAILPGIATSGDSAFVTLPHEGRVVRVAIEAGTVEQRYDIGGEPTRIIVLASSAAADAAAPATELANVSRWFSAADLGRGKTIYELNCAECHGDRGQGNYGKGNMATAPATAPPALDGSGRAPERSLAQALAAINAGSGMAMPGFDKLLGDEEKLLALAYYQTYWPADAYSKWATANEAAMQDALR